MAEAPRKYAPNGLPATAAALRRESHEGLPRTVKEVREFDRREKEEAKAEEERREAQARAADKKRRLSKAEEDKAKRKEERIEALLARKMERHEETARRRQLAESKAAARRREEARVREAAEKSSRDEARCCVCGDGDTQEGNEVRRDRGAHCISARFTYDGGHFCGADRLLRGKGLRRCGAPAVLRPPARAARPAGRVVVRRV
jgi:hypothetical protein